MGRFVGIDVGTSGTKAIVIDESGNVLKTARREYELNAPQPGWAEQNPTDWWQASQECLDELCADDCDAIGLTGQMHGSVFLNGEGEVVHPALLWCDQRTAAECEQIDEAVGAARLREITGNPPLTGFQLPKILWLRNHHPELFSQVKHVLLPKDFIGFKLTGELKTEVSDASGVGALDLQARDWSVEVLEPLGPVSYTHLTLPSKIV